MLSSSISSGADCKNSDLLTRSTRGLYLQPAALKMSPIEITRVLLEAVQGQ